MADRVRAAVHAARAAVDAVGIAAQDQAAAIAAVVHLVMEHVLKADVGAGQIVMAHEVHVREQQELRARFLVKLVNHAAKVQKAKVADHANNVMERAGHARIVRPRRAVDQVNHQLPAKHAHHVKVDETADVVMVAVAVERTLKKVRALQAEATDHVRKHVAPTLQARVQTHAALRVAKADPLRTRHRSAKKSADSSSASLVVDRLRRYGG